MCYTPSQPLGAHRSREQMAWENMKKKTEAQTTKSYPDSGPSHAGVSQGSRQENPESGPLLTSSAQTCGPALPLDPTPVVLSPKVRAIRALTAAGFILIPLRGKEASYGWRSIVHGQYGEDEIGGGNYGIALGPNQIAVDVDPRHAAPGDNPLLRLSVFVAGLPDSFVVQSGGADHGRHIFATLPAGAPKIRHTIPEYKGLDFRGHGQYVVGPGSIHPDTRNEYTVISGPPKKLQNLHPDIVSLYAASSSSGVGTDFGGGAGTSEYKDDDATKDRFISYLHCGAPQGEGSFRVACTGRDYGLSPAVTWDLMCEEWESGGKTAEELKTKVLHAYKYASGAVGSAHPETDFQNLPLPPVFEAPAHDKDLRWENDKNGKPKRTFANLRNYFKLSKTGLCGVFGFNSFVGRVEIMNPAPWHKGILPACPGVTDTDLKLCKAFLVDKHGFETSVQNIDEIITAEADIHKFHPVRDYLDGLKWDGVKRLDGWLHDYMGAADDVYTRACSRKTLCAAVARVYRPGVKFDHVLVLEGAQGIGKSTAVAILGGKWFGDPIVDPHSKDTIQGMQGRWILEMAEMVTHNQSDVQELRSFLSRGTDTVRPPYGRLPVEHPRQSIFIATTNPGPDGTYLKDETGNRRWWPVMCAPRGGILDFKAFKAVRDQLFAEAVEAVKGGEAIYMDTDELRGAAADATAQRHAEHPWTEKVGDWVAGLPRGAGGEPVDFITGRQVFVDALGGIDKQFTHKEARSIASAMKSLGWESVVRRISDEKVMRGYARKEKGAASVSSTVRESQAAAKKKILDILGELA